MDNFNWREKLDQFKLPIGLSVVGIVLIVGGMFASGLTKQPSTSSGQNFPKESLVQPSQKQISVDISGAVEKPGVYKLSDGSRIEDVVKMAGGFSKEANTEYISKYLNMAQKISDGSKIYVPLQGEQAVANQAGVVGGTTSLSGVNSTGVKSGAKVNVNTATQAELEALPGIGPVTASKIISDRPFGSVEELLSKKVLGKSVFEKIKDQLVLY